MTHGVLTVLELQKKVHQYMMYLLTEVVHTQRAMKLGFLVSMGIIDLEVRHQLAGVVNGTDHLQSVVVRNIIQINIKKKLFLSHCSTKINLLKYFQNFHSSSLWTSSSAKWKSNI